MRPFDETVIWSGSNAVAYALEVNEGWFDYQGIQMGTKVYGIPSPAKETERRTNGRDRKGQEPARNEVRSGGFWIK